MPKNPRDAIVHEYELRHADGSAHRYRVTLDPAEVTRDLANHARSNKSRKATICGGAVVVQHLAQTQLPRPKQ